jgi:putative ABC transport system permease protein
VIRHLLRLVWNRKRQNVLVALEIFLSFGVLFAITFTVGVNYYNWRQPLGFDVDGLWTIQLGYPYSGPARPEDTAEQTAGRARAAETLVQVLAAVNAFPEVERAATSWPSMLYTRGGWMEDVGTDGFRSGTAMHIVSDEFREVLGLTVVAGRWFSREDDGRGTEPAIINARLARALFGEASPINRELQPPGQSNAPALRIVGVIEEFRHDGELGFPGHATLVRPSVRGTPAALPNVLTIRVRPGTTAEVEEKLVRTLQNVAPDWTFDVRSVATRREEAIHKAVVPIALVTILAVFLLLMVALGLTGVVWQSVTTRIHEFGLRRAKGATAGDIRRQVVLELVLLASLAIIVGAVIAVQIPALPLLAPASVRFASVAAAVAVIYLLTLLCAWYPSRLATRIQPADALHYE